MATNQLRRVIQSLRGATLRPDDALLTDGQLLECFLNQRDPAGFGLFGVSRGGSVALCVAADDPAVWAVATDGAFPTRGTMLAYILRWAEVYVGHQQAWRYMPLWVFRFVGWAGRLRSERRLRCHRQANNSLTTSAGRTRCWPERRTSAIGTTGNSNWRANCQS